MISLDQFKEKYDLLMTLSNKHPAFLDFMTPYLSYVESHLPELGSAGGSMYDDLSAKISANKQIDTMREMCLEVRRVGRSKEIMLNKAPLVNYVFSRVISTKFIKEVKASNYFDVESATLFRNKDQFLVALQQTFSVMRNASDMYDYYSDFKACLISMVGNGVAAPDDIKQYIPIFKWFEADIEETRKKLALKDEEPSIDSMTAFGGAENILLSKSGELTNYAILTFLEKGTDFLLKMSKSEDDMEQRCYEALVSKFTASEYDPICDFISDAQHGTRLMAKYTKSDILSAQKVCQSILNLYTPDLLVQTALSDYYDVVINRSPYDLDSLIEVTSRNLTLLQSYDIITIETHDNFLKKIQDELS